VSVRETVRRIRIDLERVAARESVLPSHVTLSGRLPLAKALVELSRQTGNPIAGDALPPELLHKPFDFNFAEVSFWQALDDLTKRLELHYEYDASARGLKVAPNERGAEARPAVGYSGAFRVEVLRAERLRTAPDQKPGEPNDLLRVSVVVWPEPRLRALFLQIAAADIKARAGGVDLKPFSPEANYELAVGEGVGASRFLMDFVISGAVRAPTIDLEGKLRCTTAAGNEPIRFGNVAAERGPEANIARRRGGVTVVLNRVRLLPSEGKNEMRVRITVSYDTGGPAFETHRTWILHNEVFLEDRSGKRVRLSGGSETERQGDGTIAIEYRFVNLPDPLPDYAFVYVAPTLIIDVPIEFEIQSVAVETRK
jgi:hypothetical protein